MHYPPIIPYLAVADAAGALDFYKRAFGATETLRVPGDGGRGIVHAETRIGEGVVMLADSAPAIGFPAPEPGKSVPVGIMVRWPSPADVDRLFAQALTAGGSAETEPRDEPWGARFAGVLDPYGHRWWLFAMRTGDA